MIKDLISIIVPVYNVEKYLRASLDSMLGQTYQRIEIILVDDGSTDGSGRICDEYAEQDSRIKVIHQKNGGVSKARNVALNVVCGEYVSFVDSDDTVESTYLEFMLKEMRKYDVDLVRCGWFRGNSPRTYFVPFNERGEYLVDFSNANDLLCFANIWGLFKSEGLKNIRFDEDLKYAEDNLFVFEYFIKSEKKKMLLLKSSMYHYAIVRDSATHIDVFEQIKRSNLFLDRIEKLEFPSEKMKAMKDRYIYKDYLILYYYFVDRKINSKEGFSKQDILFTLKKLRKLGCREYTVKEKMVSFLYRHHLHALMDVFRVMKKCLNLN